MTAVVALAAITVAMVMIALGSPDGHPVSAAFTVQDEAWPPEPSDGEVGEALAAVLLARAEQREEGPPPDAGPGGTAPPDEPALDAVPDVPGMQVRIGERRAIWYFEVVVGEASFDDPLPMALLIHGRGDRARLPGGPFLGLSQPLRVIVPQAPDPLGRGYEWLPVRVGSGLIDRLTTSLMARAGQLAHLLRDLREELPTKGRAIVVGFSQGGLLTFTLATHFSDVVGAAFPLAAWLPPALVPPYRRPDISFPAIRGLHGLADRVIPFDPTATVYETMRERGFDVSLQPFPEVGHEMSDAMNSAMHAWLEAAVSGEPGELPQEALPAVAPPPCTDPAGCPGEALDGGTPGVPLDGSVAAASGDGGPDAGLARDGGPDPSEATSPLAD